MNVVIHIGPPKTGTSAIQKWLNENREFLNENGLFYPEHSLDINGISSGNLFSLYTPIDNDLVLDGNKLQLLKNSHTASGARTLLLSSEFFFNCVEELAEVFPQAIFIGYLRFPLDVAESSYNQGVKRHNEVRAFGLPSLPEAHQLNTLDSVISVVGKQRFILRPYHDKCFVGGNLVEDFLSQINVAPKNIDSMKINTSYTLEGLEFKRWFNQLPLDTLQGDMDTFLQRQQEGIVDYSFIPPITFEKLRNEFTCQLRSFCHRYEVNEAETFIVHCKSIEQKPKLPQFISNETFEIMLRRFLREPKVLKKVLYLYESEWKYQSVEKSPERLSIVEACLPRAQKVLSKIRALLGRAGA